LALLAKTKQEFSDSLFLLKQYDTGFKSPVSELFEIMSHTTISSYRDMFVKRNLGFEYFTNANCLMIKEDKIGWLKNNI
jgi:transposase